MYSDFFAVHQRDDRFADQVGRLEIRYDAFTEEFSTILQRHAARGHAGAAPAPAPTATSAV